MSIQLEGTWEEVVAHAGELTGRRVRLTVLPDQVNGSNSRHDRPIEEVISDIMADVPEEEWNKLPSDLSEQLDHYVYGAAKRP